MAMTVCHECKKDISSTAKACPHCGAEAPKTKIWPWIIGIPVILFVGLMIIGFFASNSPRGQEKAKARDAISLCWEEQQDKSITPESQRFIASVCYKMEQEFRDKYRASP
nr:hypothetical protein [Pseudomonas sp. NFPP33]